jgi:hypothetical protein
LARQSFNLSFQNRQKPAWPIHDKARSGWAAFVPMLIAARCSFFALRRFAAICRSLAIVSELPIAPNAMFPRHQMADIQRSSKLALLSLRPWRLALVTQLLALQAPPEAKRRRFAPSMGDFLSISAVVQ